MTPVRFRSCTRLLRGITILAELNRIKIHEIVAKKDRLNVELQTLARLIGEDRFADQKLLSSMSRRIGHTLTELNSTKLELSSAHKKEIKYDRAKTLLTQRIRKHEIESEEESLLELTSLSLTSISVGQSATRKQS
jgi:hypothetical protein